MERYEAVLKIPVTDDIRHKHIYKALRELSNAGIHFDTGCGCGYYDWELDWSLDGAELYFKKFYDGKLPSEE